MSVKSIHLDTLEKIQHMLDGFDMSFRLSNKMFRLAIVSEIIDATCLFEQLYKSWCEKLPFGEGADADVDFAYWQHMDAWKELRNNAQQNLCIVSAGIDFGNGTYSDDTDLGKCRKTYSKHLKEAVKSVKFVEKDVIPAFLKALDSKDFDITSFGNLVFYSLAQLTSVLRKIQMLLDNPPESLIKSYSEDRRGCFVTDFADARKKMAGILEEDLPDRRKLNKLKTFCKDLQINLFDSGFVDDLVGGVTEFDVDDFRHDRPADEFDDTFIKRSIALSELVDSDGALKSKANRYLYEHRRQLNSKAVGAFFMYVDLKPALEKMIAALGDRKENDILPTEIVGQMNKLSKLLQTTPANVSINISLVQGDQVMHKDANIDKNFGTILSSE